MFISVSILAKIERMVRVKFDQVLEKISEKHH
jgi:hypothetical protein